MRAYTARARRPTSERNQLIAQYVDVARRISARVARRCPDWVSRDDLTSAAMLGLTEAAERYDVNREEPFLGFAEKRIRGAVLDELRRGDIMPRRARQKARAVGAAIAELEQTLSRSPTDEEIAAKLEVSLEEYQSELEVLVHVTCGSFEASEDMIQQAPDTPSPETAAGRAEAVVRVRTALENLDKRDVQILALYYNEELTYTEIGEVLGVTTSRVCQLHGRAIARLRAELDPPKRRGT